MSSQELKLEVAGLSTSPNPFGASPSGSFAVADNCVIRDAGILESRRGVDDHSALPGGERLSSYQGHLLGLANDTLNYYTSSWNALTGSFVGPDGGLTPVRFLEAARSKLFTTETGVWVMDAYNANPRRAGVPAPLAPWVTALQSPIDSALDTWFLDDTQVAYRLVFGYVDANTELILSAPSQRAVIVNNTGIDVYPVLRVLLWPWLGITAGMFLRLYRSPLSASATIPPIDEMQLSVQHTITADDVANQYFDIFDAVPQDELSTALYTNATQEGIAQANNRPPLAHDLCNFRGYTIYANTVDFHRTALKLIHADTTHQNSASLPPNSFCNGILLGDQFRLTRAGDPIGDVYTASTVENFATREYKLTTSDLPETMASLARIISYQPGPSVPVRADILSNGYMELESRSLEDEEFTVSFTPTPQAIGIGDMTRSFGGTVDVTQVGHNYQNQTPVLLDSANPDPNFPTGIVLVSSVIDANHWSYSQAGANVSNTTAYTSTHAQQGDAWQFPDGQLSTNSTDLAGLRYSKVNQPQACPLEDQDTVGDPTAAILRVQPLRESVIILKEDGIYRLTGNSPADFEIQPYDLTTFVTAPETVRAMTDNCIAWTNKGVWAYGESSGGQSISKPIDETLFGIQYVDPSLAATSFAVAYEAEQMYILWVPGESATNPGFPYTWPVNFGEDVLAGGQAYVFNARSGTWTRWTIQANDAIIDPTTGKLVLTNGGDVLIERKDGTDTDYQDVGGTANITVVTNSTHITMSGPQVGDLVTQGAYSSIVTAVNGSALTLATAGTWSVASADYARAIECNVQWLPAAGENPGTKKQFSELALNFRQAQFNFIDAEFSTDVTQTAETKRRFGNPAKPYNVSTRTQMPVNMSRAVMINCGFQHKQALCNFLLQSSSLIYRQVSTRVPSFAAP